MAKKNKRNSKKRRQAKYLFFGDLIFFMIFTFALLSTAFFDFYGELGIKPYFIVGIVAGIIFTMLFGIWLSITKRDLLMKT